VAAAVTDSSLAELIFRTDYVLIADIEGWFSTLRAIRELPEVASCPE
jgi:hypothetical protein